MAENKYYARVDYIYEGGDAKFSVPFPYINKNHIVAIINEDTENPITDLEFLTSNQIQINTEIMTGATVSIRRITPLDDRFVDFTDGNILDEESQDLSALQVFDVVQEIKDSNDWLLSRMEEFTTLKSLIDKALATIAQAADNVQTALDVNALTNTLVNDIAETFEDLKNQVKNGLNAKIVRNLFEVVTFDSEVRSVDYPDAYQTLLNEFETGEKKVFTSSEETTYYKSFTGSTSGNFYLPSDSNLEVGVKVYSDPQCITELGTVQNLSTIEADKYTGSITENFYVAKDTELNINTQVYSDSILTELLGTVENLKTVTASKYSTNKSGDFYIDANQNLRVGRIIYSDAGLINTKGTITKFETISTDRYHINGLEDINEFYVPSDTVLNVGTKIYKDAGCTEELGVITGKGVISGNQSYCYTASKVIRVPFTSGSQGYVPNPFYTKNPIQVDEPFYTDNLCTKEFGKFFEYFTGGYEGWAFTCALGALIYQGVQLVNQTSSNNSNYLQINNNQTQLSYYKQAVVSAEIIAIDEGENETYNLEETVSGKYLKLNEGEYQTYNKIGSVISGTVDIQIKDSNLTHEALTDNGIGSTDGVAFIYSESTNGHKIVSSEYKNKIEELKNTNNKSEFYILDTSNISFTLPLIDITKYLYFCVGNTVLIKSGIEGVTKEYLNKILEDYIKTDDSTLQALTKIIMEYNSTVGNINNILTEILGE